MEGTDGFGSLRERSFVLSGIASLGFSTKQSFRCHSLSSLIPSFELRQPSTCHQYILTSFRAISIASSSISKTPQLQAYSNHVRLGQLGSHSLYSSSAKSCCHRRRMGRCSNWSFSFRSLVISAPCSRSEFPSDTSVITLLHLPLLSMPTLLTPDQHNCIDCTTTRTTQFQ